MSRNRNKRKKHAPFIVKLQTPLVGSEILIYNKDRSLIYGQPFTEDVSRVMHGRAKAFFWARLVGTTVHIDREAPWQEW